ncbi:hypothetical protein [Tsukamurella paurometabola]|uniref:Uncharacterized protein n=1 Tax=Tsukamurella paurometabola TaxID=2061 RepID=A0A3P8KU21_TSUPA|nr:hypothetical protein [Tsukamurella paurometabola]UEA83312.1 hypothetical protein LK411_00170 [Tsukamurella paurometabola]VDR40417.1 Uncharacterised protein [Tsukamurella paurometabola]
MVVIPEGQPNYRFMRYVRPPTGKRAEHTPLFPLRPATRPVRLGIDVATVPTPPDGYLPELLTRDEVEPYLLVQNEDEVPCEWLTLLPSAVVARITYTSVDDSERLLDTSRVPVTLNQDGKVFCWTSGHFFGVYSQLDESDMPDGVPAIPLGDRHRAAAYAAGAGAVQIDVIVTNAVTAGRADVQDNDIVLAVRPDEAVAVIGHYFRVKHNPVTRVERGTNSWGEWTRTTQSRSVHDLYRDGVISGLRYFHLLKIIAGCMLQFATVEALETVEIRLCRAVRAFDGLLAALSNGQDGQNQVDVTEATSEALDRELLYLSAAFDMFGRLYEHLLNPSVELGKSRQSLDSAAFIDKHVRPNYDASLLVDVERLQKYAWIAKQLRNRVHGGVLPAGAWLARSYGSTKLVAIELGKVPDLLPNSSNGLTQQHYDDLGAYRAMPERAFGPSTLVADVPTLGLSLLRCALGYVDAFSRVILCNKPNAAEGYNGLLGSALAQPGDENIPEPPEALHHRALFGWHPTLD